MLLTNASIFLETFNQSINQTLFDKAGCSTAMQKADVDLQLTNQVMYIHIVPLFFQENWFHNGDFSFPLSIPLLPFFVMYVYV